MNDTKLVHHVHKDDRQEWRSSDGRLHRTDGPARIWPNGDQEWFQNGRLHRTDGPAIIHANGHQEWRQYGRRHRTDGPAIIYSDGAEEWWVNGQQLTEQEVELYRFRRWAVEGELV